MFLGLLCGLKAMLGAAVVLLAGDDTYIQIAGVGHIALAPVWYWLLRR